MNRIDTQTIKPGTILQLNGYDNPKYIVIGRFNDTKLVNTINLKTFQYRRFNAWELKPISEKKDNRIQIYITDEIKSGDAILDALDEVKKAEVRRAKEKELAETKAAEEKTQLLKDYAHLEQVSNSKKSGLVIGAKNIRRELKAAFPKIKFSVRSESFSMGDAINIRYNADINPEDERTIDGISKKYQYGSFDGMTDSYNYSRNQFNDIFGGSKYVHTQNEHHFTPKTRTELEKCQDLIEKYGAKEYINHLNELRG